MEKKYQRCNQCVMDTTSKLICFDEKGECNFCAKHKEITSKTTGLPFAERQKMFLADIEKIKRIGKANKYDCIVGISGGMDSTYLAYLAKQNGLRVLLVHFDNGWNSNHAISNINKIVHYTGFDLHTHVIDWELFKDLQNAYFRASVVDIEVPTDQLIFAALYKIAKQYNIKAILSGENMFTETIMPLDWAFEFKLDYTNLKNIHSKYGERKLNNFPKIGLRQRMQYDRERIKLYCLINNTDFNYFKVIDTLQKEIGWTNYEGKHFESVFTRFYQGYILPKKFGYDKRLPHLSNLINSGFITREQALKELEKPPYPVKDQMEDLEYILKKWEMTREEFETIMKKPKVSHDEFGYDKMSWWLKFENWLYFFYRYKIAYPLGLLKRPTD